MSEGFGLPFDDANGHGRGHPSDDWAEAMARTVAHLAAQLTMSQIRLRALATEMSERGLLDDAAVARRAGQLAVTETGSYLRENLGSVLAEMIDLDALEAEIVSFLNG
jgi:hypothetical protein